MFEIILTLKVVKLMCVFKYNENLKIRSKSNIFSVDLYYNNNKIPRKLLQECTTHIDDVVFHPFMIDTSVIYIKYSCFI